MMRPRWRTVAACLVVSGVLFVGVDLFRVVDRTWITVTLRPEVVPQESGLGFDLSLPATVQAQTGLPTIAARRVLERNFAAVSDGTTDTITQLQNAVDFGGSVAKTVYLPRGTYAISAALQMRSDVCLLGESPWATVIYQTDTALDAIEMANTVASGDGVNSNMCIMSMTITHEQSTYLDAAGDGISAGDSGASWEQTTDVLLRDLIIRDIPRRSVKAWQSPQRWTLDNVVTIRAGGGGPFIINGANINVIGGRVEETGDDGFNFANGTQNVSMVGTVFDGCGTLAGSPGGQCITVIGDDMSFSGLSMRNYEDAAIEINDDNSGTYCPENIVFSGISIERAASTDGNSRVLSIDNACGDIVVSDLTADGYNYVTDEVQMGIEVANTDAAARVVMNNVAVRGVHRAFSLRALPYLSIRGGEFSVSTSGIDLVDGNTIDELRIVDSVFYGSGGNLISFQNFGTGITIGELFTRGNRNRLSSHFIRIPSGGHVITMADMRGDVQNLNASLINDIGGSSVTTWVEVGVSDSAAAASLGAVSRVIEAFDADGDSIGYVPVYDGFTPP